MYVFQEKLNEESKRLLRPLRDAAEQCHQLQTNANILIESLDLIEQKEGMPFDQKLKVDSLYGIWSDIWEAGHDHTISKKR